MIRFLIVVLLCFCATSAFATFEVIEPDAIDDSDQWDSTGGAATKTIAITDATDGNYIWTGTNGNDDRYTFGDLTSNDIETVDSVVLYWTAQDNGTGNNRAQPGIRINTDELLGTSTPLTTSWVERTESFTTPPGSRGTWDDFEIDSLVFIIKCTAIGGSREVRLTNCSLVVWYSSNERTLMYPRKDDACLTGSFYDHDLLRKSAMQNDTAFTFVNDGVGANTYWKSGDGPTDYHKMNNDDWEAGGFGVFLDVINVVADCSLQVRIQRYNSSCVLQESTPYYPASGAQLLIDTTGHYEFQIPQHDWTSGACGDELAVHFEWSNALFETDDSAWIQYGVADTYFEHEININGPGCPEGTGAGDCAGQPSTDTVGALPDQEGGIAQWVNVGGADLITSISDDVDANYMLEDAASGQQEVQFAAISEPGDLAQYDSISVIWRGRRNSVGGGQVRVRTQLNDSTDAANKECNDTYSNLRSVAFEDFEPLTVTGLPSGIDACEGAITTAGINTLEVKVTVISLGNNKEAWITSMDLIVCYAIVGGDQNFRRIRMIKQLGRLDDKSVWDSYFDQTMRRNSTYETSVTFGVGNPNRWAWAK